MHIIQVRNGHAHNKSTNPRAISDTLDVQHSNDTIPNATMLQKKKKKISKIQLQYKPQVYHTRLLGKIFAISNSSDLSKALQSIFREQPSYAYWCGPLAGWGRSRDPLVPPCYGHDMHTGARLFLILMSSGANVYHTYWLDFDSQPENL